MTCLAVAALIAAVGDARAQTQARTSDSVSRVRLTPQRWTVGGVPRSGLVAAPIATDSLASTRGVPLVFVFHGHGGSSAGIARTLAVHTAWPEAMVVYLQGLPAPGRVVDPTGRLPGWQGAPGELGDRDLALFDTVLAWARHERRIDPGRVYAAGHSNGGLFTYVLWSQRGDVFAAFAPAAAAFGSMVESAKPKPAFIIAGRRDALVPFVVQQRSLDAALRLNQCAPEGTPWATDAVLHRSAVGADVVAYIHPGGHPLPADAATQIVRFFKSVRVKPR